MPEYITQAIDETLELVTLHADGETDDTAFYQAVLDNRLVGKTDGFPVEDPPTPGDYMAKPKQS